MKLKGGTCVLKVQSKASQDKVPGPCPHWCCAGLNTASVQQGESRRDLLSGDFPPPSDGSTHQASPRALDHLGPDHGPLSQPQSRVNWGWSGELGGCQLVRAQLDAPSRQDQAERRRGSGQLPQCPLVAKSSPSPPPGAQTAVQLLRPAQLFLTPWTEACQASLSSTVSRSLLKFVSVESVMPSNQLILCCPPSPPTLNRSQHQGLFQ